MYSVMRVFAIALLIGFFLPATRTEVVAKKAVAADGATPVIAAAVAQAGDVSAANSLGTGSSAASDTFPVSYFDSEKMAAALNYKKYGGYELLSWKGGESSYRVLVSRREANGLWERSESHAFTHIFYILEGSAKFVYGGTFVNPKTIGRIHDSPGSGEEIRGTALEGGKTILLSKGNVIVVPRGVPHWWKEVVEGPMIYFVVQVRSDPRE